MTDVLTNKAQALRFGCGARVMRVTVMAVWLATLAACGGSGGGGGGSASAEPAGPDPVSVPAPAPTPSEAPDRPAAARFLTQASFGPDEASIARVQALGYAAWIDEQFAVPASSHLAN